MIEHNIAVDFGPGAYTCVCGYHNINRLDVDRHVAFEYERTHRPYWMITIASADQGPPVGIEIRFTPYSDACDAVEFVTITRAYDGKIGVSFKHAMVLVPKSSLPFLIEQLEDQHKAKAPVLPEPEPTLCAACSERLEQHEIPERLCTRCWQAHLEIP